MEALAASVDIGAAMVMRNMDLASIKDPDVPPLPIQPKPAKDPVRGRELWVQGGWLLATACWHGCRQGLVAYYTIALCRVC